MRVESQSVIAELILRMLKGAIKEPSASIANAKSHARIESGQESFKNEKPMRNTAIENEMRTAQLA